MSRYADLDLSLTRNPITGAVSPLTDAQAVSRSIQNIILTIAGEKKFNPTFGGSLRAMLFEQMDPFTTLKIKDGFTRAIYWCIQTLKIIYMVSKFSFLC